MRNKLFMRISALLLAVVFVFLLPVRVYALSGVISGITGGLGLTMGELAGLILAGAGVVVGSLTIQEYGDDLQRTLNQAMKAEQAKFYTDPAMQAQVLEELNAWKAKAQAGYIELESGVAWIVDSVKDWAFGFLRGDALSVPYTPALLPAGEVWHQMGSYSVKADVDVMCFKFRWYTTSGTENLTWMIAHRGNHFTYTYENGRSYQSSSSCKVDGVSYSLAGRTIGGYSASDAAGSFLIDGSYPVTASGTMQKAIAVALGGSLSDSVYPEAIVGGVADQISQGVTMDVIGLPDISVPGADVLPVNPSEGQTEAAAITDYLLAALLAGTITWEQYWEIVGVYSPGLGTGLPTISIPNTETGVGSDRFEITDEGVSSVPVTPPLVSDFSLDLRDFFPFCIPFDIYDMLNAFDADPVAPYFELELNLGVLGSFPIEIDFSVWNGAAEICRLFEFVCFCIGLAVGTKKLLGW